MSDIGLTERISESITNALKKQKCLKNLENWNFILVHLLLFLQLWGLLAFI